MRPRHVRCRPRLGRATAQHQGWSFQFVRAEAEEGNSITHTHIQIQSQQPDWWLDQIIFGSIQESFTHCPAQNRDYLLFTFIITWQMSLYMDKCRLRHADYRIKSLRKYPENDIIVLDANWSIYYRFPKTLINWIFYVYV